MDIKRITSHAGHARFLAYEVAEFGIRCIARIRSIPSPYAFSPDHLVHLDSKDREVFIVETAHKQYDVFLVPDFTPSFVDVRSIEEVQS